MTRTSHLSTRATQGSRIGALAFGVLLGAAACDGAAPAVDASAPPSARTSAVSLRIDVPAGGKPASLTVLAFRAAFSGVASADVLGLVDPLAAAAPVRDCQVRDVGQSAAALVARGDAIELEELSGVGITLGDRAEIRPSPRLYPDLAATIGGVVGEAGPLGLVVVPDLVRVSSSATLVGTDGAFDAATVAIPTTGWVRLLNGAVPHDGSLVEIAADLNINLTTGAAVTDGTKTGAKIDTKIDTKPSTMEGIDAETSVELRPFGATVALTCLVPANSTTANTGANITTGQIAFMVPRQALSALVAMSGATPGAPVAAALDLVRRSNHRLPLSATRVTVEVRTSTFVELRP